MKRIGINITVDTNGVETELMGSSNDSSSDFSSVYTHDNGCLLCSGETADQGGKVLFLKL